MADMEASVVTYLIELFIDEFVLNDVNQIF